MCRRKFFALLAALSVFMACAVPVSASSNSAWVELLEYSTVNNAGNNLVTSASSTVSFYINTPQKMRVNKVDMLLSHPSGYAPTSIEVYYSGTYYPLTLAKIDEYTTRAYGANIPNNIYTELTFRFRRNTTSQLSYQILSCRVTSIEATEMNATAYAEIDGTTYNVPFAESFTNEYTTDVWGHFQFPVVVKDWQKFDTITISGSLSAIALSSIRATVGGLGLPYEMSYAVSPSGGSTSNSYQWHDIKYYSYDDTYKGSTEETTYTYNDYHGKVLFSLTIDLSGLDRTSTNNLYCYFTGLANPFFGYDIQLLKVTGTVNIADTSNTTWWTRFTSFMRELFGSDTSDSDQFQEEAENQGSELDNLNEQLNAVTKPPIEDITVDVGDFISPSDIQNVSSGLSEFTNDSLVVSIISINLIVALVAYILYGKR